ncbi:putative kinetochore protein spc-25 [Venustampulla echinocandica]|uniref:Kinetochore protein SPC25 n=1 Tax=Venustampulla echinocandica TaxID=2656787 RepID=A0A370TU24_9HELO|nr:putative kinetochore protein spc-25 [Venustampulla echinocandica]RDL39033.1 putative kinetochore protein spc-25 [Venustampulla echinocandica]
MRPPLTSADAPSMADSLPSINFGFDELRDRMAKFTVRFDNFIEQGRKRVLEERNQFRMNVAELQEDQRMKKKDIEILSSKTSAHQQTLEKEMAETNEMQAAIASLSMQRDAHLVTKESLKQQIAETQKQIDARLAAQRAHAQHQDSQSRFNIPELDFWTSTLCMTLEGAGQDDRLKFVFTHIDDRDWTREAFFELDTSKRDYEIPYCKPKLEKDQIERVLDQLNEHRDLRVLLKGMRDLFMEAMK